jgi:DNA-binding response OmpR family regulator
MDATTILIVDDDVDLTAVVAEYLSGHAMAVQTCHRGDVAIERIRASPPDLVVLDLTMPGVDGLTVCRTVRGFFDGPILMLTALVDDIDEVAGLETGADDYLRKPVRPRVLLARIRSLLRRHQRAPIRAGQLRIDLGAREVFVGDTRLDLTTGEFDLLRALAEKAGEVVDRDSLYETLRGAPWDGVDRSIDLRVSRVRAKLVAGGGEAEWIKSVRGEGYQLVR